MEAGWAGCQQPRHWQEGKRQSARYELSQGCTPTCLSGGLTRALWHQSQLSRRTGKDEVGVIARSSMAKDRLPRNRGSDKKSTLQSSPCLAVQPQDNHITASLANCRRINSMTS